jgi:4-aminobutyrate aminotransferase/(S)-3-amino-2-methylpropionate transaminase
MFTTGAEAVENAVKIARAATGRSAVIAFGGAFHGRTLFALALTGKANPYKQGLGPIPGDVYRVPFPLASRGVTTADSLTALDNIFRTDVAPEQVAAIIIEPVQGEGGFNPAPPELMTALRTLCDHHGIILIADEIQSGFARTGKLFALEHYDVQADLMVMAKSLAGGLPLSAVTGNATIMDAPVPGALGGTYAGSPLACAAALAVLKVIDEERLIERAALLGTRVRTQLQSFIGRNDLVPIGNIRGLGAMVGFDVVDAQRSTRPVPGAAAAIVKRAHQLGLVLLGCGSQGEAIRLLFPLTASTDIIDEGMNLLTQALTPK